MAKRTRREFLRASVVAAAAIVVGCDDDSAAGDPAGTDGGPDAKLRTPPDAGADAAARDADAGPDADEPSPDAAADAFDIEPDAAEADEGVADGADDTDVPDQGPVPDDLPESDAFPMGVASGDVTAAAAVLWAQYTGEGPLEVVVWETGPDGERIHDRAVVEIAEGGFVHYDAGGLTPGAFYRYAFYVAEGEAPVARSAFGRFRAAIADDALEAITFGAGSCTRNGFRFPTLLRAGARDDLDLYLLLGDTTYADGAVDRAQYRAKWAQNLTQPAYHRLRESTSVVATWDDHEVDNNWDPETIEPGRLAAARGAFFEHLPIRRDAMAPERIWRRFRWGRTAEFFVLDCRGERLPSTREGPDSQYISEAQMDWLQAGLRDSDAVFKVIVNSVPMGDFPTFGVNDDRWQGYEAARDALLVFLDVEAIEGVFVVSGDFHLASAGRLTAEGPGSDIPEFLVGPGEQFPNPLALILPGTPNIDWALAVNNYATFTLDPVAREVDVAYYGSAGQVLMERTVAI